MADEETWERFKLECLQKRGYALDFENYCRRVDRVFSNPPRPGIPSPVPKELFTTLPAICQLRSRNHPKTKAEWHAY